MNKVLLIERLAEITDEQKIVCKRILEALLELVGDTLKDGHEIALTGFGTFTTSHRKARTGINPVTGKKMSIAEKIVPKFRAGKGLKVTVSGE